MIRLLETWCFNCSRDSTGMMWDRPVSTTTTNQLMLGLVIFKFCQLSKQRKQSMLDELQIHHDVRSMTFQDNYWIALKRHDLLSDRICKVYFRYIPCINYAYTMRRLLASHLCCPSALGSLRPGLPSELLSFGHREAAHASLGPYKVPQPGVDLVNMAAPPRGRASTIGNSRIQKRPSVGCSTYVE
jgi:hypothetical protein